LYVGALLLVLIAVLAYTVRIGAWRDETRYRTFPALLVAMLLLLFYVHESGSEAAGAGAPVLVAVAADVSLSMGTIPEPGAHGHVGTRLERAQAVLLPLFARLASAARPTLVSVLAFTAKAETILAWDDDLTLAGEIVEYVLTTGLLTEAGSDLGAVLTACVPLFESLPEAYRDAEFPKYLLLVSDGEQTGTQDFSDASLAKLRELGVSIVALNVGLAEPQEGLPVFDAEGQFVGFEEVGGQIFSTPDPDVMRSIAGETGGRGLFVKAENGNAVATITDFIGLQSEVRGANAARAGAVLLLWGALMFVLMRRL
jgi:hypothetical protein